ncbi:MAG: hypothetical protein HQL57_01205 [Magnetococcales bacterium]|nr:hypothetical protein [Magnetococcales bacterium]MBF0155788.1 hypothetical protein [Magnetococcales bacterium]
MSVTGIENTTGQAARPGEIVLQKIKASAEATPRMFDQKTIEASNHASEYTRKEASQSYRVTLSSETFEKGAVYAKPR